MLQPLLWVPGAALNCFCLGSAPLAFYDFGKDVEICAVLCKEMVDPGFKYHMCGCDDTSTPSGSQPAWSIQKESKGDEPGMQLNGDPKSCVHCWWVPALPSSIILPIAWECWEMLSCIGRF